MAEPFQRHDLVQVDPAAWAAWRADRPDLATVPHLAGWAASGRPLIVRRPADGKRRIGLALPASALSPAPAVSIAEAATHAPKPWGSTVNALTALGRRHGLVPRPFGSLLWQAVTGLTYLSTTSDLDLLWPGRPPVPSGLLDGIAAVADKAPMGIDGEILLPDGAGLHWRELRDAPEDGAVLAKSLDRLALRPVAGLRGPGPA
ncbi:malonate decarboxylase holo-[acyl-carrier-protein] synthase [Methylobacterium oryzae]|uniref:malonate decarboxylase holo-[acyl-carrier-protein] synthase n=1 Tax=Methylobacterium oryzae TaxID=334852 RepID=UPI002F2D2B97